MPKLAKSCPNFAKTLPTIFSSFLKNVSSLSRHKTNTRTTKTCPITVVLNHFTALRFSSRNLPQKPCYVSLINSHQFSISKPGIINVFLCNSYNFFVNCISVASRHVHPSWRVCFRNIYFYLVNDITITRGFLAL